ncbi:hypothetical protein [Actinoplanes sp. NPDC049118]|uniref:hypothetical protein n=1 Tax=Actinoplanes sp. NPDC049118 TaxID=3155769 RepID=UPI0033D8E26F
MIVMLPAENRWMLSPVAYARAFLAGQAALPALMILTILQGMFDGQEIRTPLGPQLQFIGGMVMISTIVVAVAIRLGAARPWSWAAALAIQLSALVACVWYNVAIANADSPEGLASFVALVLGAPVAFLSVTGSILLLRPRSVRYVFTRMPGTEASAAQ